jgi:hypothetical protein
MGKVAKKVTWMARATTTVVGLTIMLALVFGVATTALAGTGVGARFQLGQTNTVNAITKLVGSVAGPSLVVDNNSTGAGATALDLQVEAGKAPMKVNSDAQVANLNSDKLDGKSASEIGVNGLTRVAATSVSNSESPKIAFVYCPPGKVIVGTGFGLTGNNTGAEADVVMDDVHADSETSAIASAFEEEPTANNWSVTATALCATAP